MKVWAERQGWVFDQGRTFMLDCDRYGAGEDFALTYRRLGGRELAAEVVQQLVGETFRAMKDAYLRPGEERAFPRFAAALEGVLKDPLPASERARLEAVFAAHEVGTIAAAEVNALRAIAPHRRLALLSNIFSPPTAFEQLHHASGLDGLFEVKVWSEREGTIKPDPALFAAVESRLALPPEELVYLGDNWARDIVPAKARGWAAVWINRRHEPIPDGAVVPDAVLPDLSALLRWINV